MEKKKLQGILLKMENDPGRLVNYFLIAFFIIGLLLSVCYDTWAIGLGAGSLLIAVYFMANAAQPASDLYQYVLSAVLGLFTVQFTYQLHGLPETVFFAFISSALLVLYRNWKLQIPLAIIMIVHLVVFTYLQYVGVDDVYFTQPDHMTLQIFFIHITLVTAICFLCGLWAFQLNLLVKDQKAQRSQTNKLQEASVQKEVLTAMSESLKASNERLRKAHSELQTLFENIQEVFFSMQVSFVENVPCFTLLQMSPACLKVYGYENDDFFKNAVLWREVVVKEDQYIIDEHFQLLEKGKAVIYKYRITHKDGSTHWVETKVTPTLDNKKALVRIDGTTTDITERKLAEEELQTSLKKILTAEKVMKSAEAIAHFGSWQFDLVKEETQWSDEVFAIYGYEPGGCVPSYELFLKHLHKEDLEHIRNRLANAVQNYNSQKFNFRIIDNKGLIKYVQAELVIERDEAGNPLQISGFIQDVTEKKVLENRLSEEKRQKQQQITEAVITAQERERLFLGEELHDNINPILATVKLYLDCALTDEDRRINLLMDSKTFISTAMDEIRTLSRSLVPPSLKEIGLKEALTNMIENVKRANGIDFITDWNGFDENILSEKLKLTIFRIVQEQLTNIFKHAEAKIVTITLKQQGSSVLLSIKDDGVGFDTSKKRKGVGLQNIASRTDLFNGEVIIRSQPQKGCELIATFNIEMGAMVNAN